MKILFYAQSLIKGGRERRIVELIKGLLKYPDISVELVLIGKIIQYDEIYSYNIPIHFTLRKFRLDLSPMLSFGKIVNETQPDIIHTWSYMSSLYALPIKVIKKIILINSEIADAPYEIKQPFPNHNFIFKMSDRILSNSYAGLKSYNAPSNKSHVIYNGFDFINRKVKISKTHIKAIHNIKQDNIVAMIASMIDKKDYRTYLRAANKICEIRQDIAFLCVGDGQMRSELQNEFIKEISSDRIYFLGRQNDVESIINACDIGILMTNESKHGEGIPNAILEFMAFGKPVIVSKGGGVAELVENNYSGFVVTPSLVEELVMKILKLIDDKELAKQFGERSLKIIKERFELSIMVEQYYNVYKNLYDSTKKTK